jgi:hypothetical protein
VYFATVASKHTVHRQAAFGILADVSRYPIRWKKNAQFASEQLTPAWVMPFVEECVDSILILGYVAWKLVGDILVTAPLCSIDVAYVNHRWVASEAHKEWTVEMVTPPLRMRDKNHPDGLQYRTPAASAYADTKAYDELLNNTRQRDHYNSRPTIFTTIDKQLKNSNGSNRQWFAETTARDAAAARTVNIDSSFQHLIATRADTVERLDEQSHLHRERLRGNAPVAEKSYVADGNMDHKEHIVSDGREAFASRQLLSLVDGEHLMQKLMFDIFFAYRAPPQILGINVNAERTSINPRLNELVLSMFFDQTAKIRQVIGRVLAHVEMEGSVLVFQTRFTKLEIDRVEPLLKTAKLIAIYADTYQLDAKDFDKERVERHAATSADHRPQKRKAGGIEVEEGTEDGAPRLRRKQEQGEPKPKDAE